MYILIWIIFVLSILALVAISEREIAKQDAEWRTRATQGLIYPRL